MAISVLTALDLGTNQLLNIKLQNLASDPAANESGVYYNTTAKEIRFHNGTTWVALGPAGAGGPPTGGASGDLTGSYPGPTIALGKVIANYLAPNTFATGDTINSVSGTATAGTPALRSLGTTADRACAGNDSRLSDARTPLGSATASGDLAGSTWANLQIAAGAIVDADVAAANKDGAVGTYSLRTLGYSGNSAMPGIARLDQIAVPTATVNLNSQVLSNVATPASGTDAANKNYVDNTVNGLSWKDAVRAATTANGTLASAFQNGSVIDGVTLATGNRILLKNQTTTTENGLYTVNASGAPTRATDADSAAEIEQMAVFVMEGTTLADTAWLLTTNAPITIGSTGLTYAQFGAGATYTGGTGILLSANDFSLSNPDGTLTLGADTVAVASAPKWTTTRTITLTGDVTSSAVNIDGTGNVSIATAVGSTGTAPPKFFAVNVGDGANGGTGGVVAPVITHNLNSRDVTVEVYRSTTPWDTVMTDCERTTVNTVTLRFTTAPAANTYRVVISGR